MPVKVVALYEDEQERLLGEFETPEEGLGQGLEYADALGGDNEMRGPRPIRVRVIESGRILLSIRVIEGGFATLNNQHAVPER